MRFSFNNITFQQKKDIRILRMYRIFVLFASIEIKLNMILQRLKDGQLPKTCCGRGGVVFICLLSKSVRKIGESGPKIHFDGILLISLGLENSTIIACLFGLEIQRSMTIMNPYNLFCMTRQQEPEVEARKNVQKNVIEI